MGDNFKCYSLIVVHACSIVVHKWVCTLLSLLFSAISISISNIFRYYFYTSFCGFLNPFTDLDSVFKLLEYAVHV